MPLSAGQVNLENSCWMKLLLFKRKLSNRCLGVEGSLNDVNDVGVTVDEGSWRRQKFVIVGAFFFKTQPLKQGENWDQLGSVGEVLEKDSIPSGELT